MSRYIDADALKEKCGEWYTEEGYEEGYIGTLKQLLDKQPTIEPKQGKWIDAEIRHEDGVLPIQVCSECKTFYPLEYTGGGHRFCPNCGADMRKGADDEASD